MKTPPYIVYNPKYGTYSKNARFKYWDMLNDVGIMKNELEAYIKSHPPMIYWQTWQAYQKAKVIRIHALYQ